VGPKKSLQSGKERKRGGEKKVLGKTGRGFAKNKIYGGNRGGKDVKLGGSSTRGDNVTLEKAGLA